MRRIRHSTPESSVRCIGLELGGSKSARTALVVLDYFPKEQKIFLVDTQAQVQGDREHTGDDILLEELQRYRARYLAVNAPLSLPPCFTCALPNCPGYRACKVPAVRWMRKESERTKQYRLHKAPTPYTQRPIDLALRGLLQEGLSVEVPVDETLGAGPAPLAARFQYLRRHLDGLEFAEVNPRVVANRLSEWYGFTARILKRYRDLQEGLEYRLQMLRILSSGTEAGIPQFFLYEEDIELLAREMGLFDALLSGLMAVFQVAQLTEDAPEGFASDWTMSLLPKRRLRTLSSRIDLQESQD